MPNKSISRPQTMLGDGTNITRQYTECIWEKDTDQMVWWPPEIKPCDGQSIEYFSPSKKLVESPCLWLSHR